MTDSLTVKPAFAERNIPVVFATDANYLPYLAVAINSLVANTKSGSLDVLVLYRDISAAERAAFLSGFAGKTGLSVRFVDVLDFAVDGALSSYVQGRYQSVATCYRLFLPEILPAYDKVVYLDVDTIVCRDIGELLSVDIGGNLFAAAIDIVNASFKPDYCQWAEDHGFTEWSDYVNAGVVLFNLAELRKANLVPELARLAVEASKWFSDQDALNFLCKGRIARLDPRWNVQVGAYCLKKQLAITKDEAFVIHYTGSTKPWNSPWHPYAHLWWGHVADLGFAVAQWRKAFNVAAGETEVGEGVAVSVVMPVYNAEPYLAEMLVSMSAQTLRNIEIICIDDGSTDGSRAICERFAAHDCRFRVLSQKNSGAAIARNRGIGEAKGRWLIFADADDFCRPDMLAEMLARGEQAAADGKMADVVVAAYRKIDHARQGAVFEDRVPAAYAKRPGGLNYRAEGVVSFPGLTYAPWNKLYRREFVVSSGVRFHQIPTSDDVYFVFVTLLRAERIVFLPRPFYYYRMNLPTSQMGCAEKHPTAFLDAILEVREHVVTADAKVRRLFYRESVLCCLGQLFISRTAARMRAVHKLLTDGGFKALSLPGVDAGKVDFGGAAVFYDLLCRGADLEEFLMVRNRMVTDLGNDFRAAVAAKAGLQARLGQVERERKALLGAKARLAAVEGSVSYRLGRAMTWSARKAWGGVKCLRDNGVRYTAKHAVGKIARRLGAKKISW